MKISYNFTKTTIAISALFIVVVYVPTLSAHDNLDTISVSSPLKYVHNLSPELNSLLKVLDLASVEPNELEQVTIPILIKYDICPPKSSGLRWIKQINGKYAVAYLNPLEIKALLKYPSVRYVSLGGRLYFRKMNFAGLLTPNVPVDKSNAESGSILVGIIDRNIKLSLIYDNNLKNQVIAYWDQSESVIPNAEKHERFFSLAQPHTSSVHGSIVSSIISKIAGNAHYIMIDSNWDKIDTVVALDFMKNVSLSMEKPIVVNLSAGINAGPHDGTSLYEEMLSSYVGKNFFIVTSAGNEGPRKHHIEFTRGSLDNNSINIKLQIPKNQGSNNYEASIDLWFNHNVPCEVAISSPQHVQLGKVLQGNGKVHEIDDIYICVCNDLSKPLNEATNVMVIIKTTSPSDNLCGEWDIKLRFSSPPPFVCDGWLALGPGSKGHFENYTSSRKTISPPATGKGIISVGVFSGQDHFKTFLSEGPTRDGRLKPDVFIRSKYSTSYAAAMFSGLLANIVSVQDCSTLSITELLGLIAESKESVFLPQELFSNDKNRVLNR